MKNKILTNELSSVILIIVAKATTKIECEWVHFKEDTMEDRVRVGTLKIRHNGRKARRMSSLIFFRAVSRI